MPTMEQVDRLRAYAGISEEEARDVLVETNDDLLEAVILMERRGRIKPPAGGEKWREEPPDDETPPKRENDDRYDYERHHERERQEREKYRQAKRERVRPEGSESFSQMTSRFLKFLGRLIHKGTVNKLEVRHNGEQVLSMPVILLVLALIFFPIGWWVFALLIIGLFFDYRYSFQGPHMGGGANNVMDTAADTAQNIKKDVKESVDKHHERDHSDR